MPWLKLDDNFIENDKIEHLRDRAFRIHVSALVYCAKNLTDGHVSIKGAKVLSVLLGFPIKRHIPELVDASLWKPDADADGHWIKDYLKYNPDAETVRKIREERSEAGRRGAAKRWADGNGHSNGQWQQPMGEPYAPVPVQSRTQTHLKAVTANQEIEHETDKLMKHIKGADEGTRGVLLSIARKLPVSSVAKVRESCMSRSVTAGYAVNALKSELAELEETG